MAGTTRKGMYKYLECVSKHNESIMLMPMSAGKFAHFVGWGFVVKVQRGTEFDVVRINFGKEGKKPRDIVVYENHARRQILTLKRGSVVEVFGKGLVVVETNPQGIKYRQWKLMAYGFNLWYVPTAHDFKKMTTDDEVLEQVEPLTEETEKHFTDLLDKMFDSKKGDFEDDD